MLYLFLSGNRYKDIVGGKFISFDFGFRFWFWFSFLILILILIFENDRLFILHCFFPLFVFIFAYFGALSEGGGFGII